MTKRRWGITGCKHDGLRSKPKGSQSTDDPDLQQQTDHQYRDMECMVTQEMWQQGASNKRNEDIKGKCTWPS